MPSAPFIRKQLLQVVEESVLPILQSADALRMVLAELPIHLPDSIKVSHLRIPLLEENAPSDTSFSGRWPEVRVNDSSESCLIFVLEGRVDWRLGTTTRMALNSALKNQWTKSGCHILRINEPTLLLIPPHIPYSDGSGAHWEDKRSIPPDSKIFWLNFLHNGAQCHLCSTVNGVHQSEYSLFINDPDLNRIIVLLTGELRRRSENFEVVGRAYLSALFHCLHRRLRLDSPVIANTAWLPTPELGARQAVSHADHIVERVDQFVQTHLTEPISLPQLARHCGISPTHLNRLFSASQGISVKRFVAQHRIGSAQRLLIESDLPVKEIARLVGFSQSSHFCQVFQKTAGLSPSEFRERNKNDF